MAILLVSNSFSMALIPADKRWLVPPKGFTNPSRICYFNTLIQNLLSIPQVVQLVCTYTGTDDLLLALKILFTECLSKKARGMAHIQTLRLITLAHESRGIAFGNGDEDLLELLCRFILMTDKPFRKLFESTNTITIACKCGKKSIKKENSYIQFINTSGEIQSSIIAHSNPMYKTICSCGSSPIVEYRLTKAPTVLVIARNDLQSIEETPSIIKLPGADALAYEYQLVSKTYYHMGHYSCEGLRSGMMPRMFHLSDNVITPIQPKGTPWYMCIYAYIYE